MRSRTLGSDGVLDVQISTLSYGLNWVLLPSQRLDGVHSSHRDFVGIVFRTLWTVRTSFGKSDASQVWALVETVEMGAVREMVADLVVFWKIWLHLEVQSGRSIIRGHWLQVRVYARDVGVLQVRSSVLPLNISFHVHWLILILVFNYWSSVDGGQLRLVLSSQRNRPELNRCRNIDASTSVVRRDSDRAEIMHLRWFLVEDGSSSSSRHFFYLFLFQYLWNFQKLIVWRIVLKNWIEVLTLVLRRITTRAEIIRLESLVHLGRWILVYEFDVVLIYAVSFW